MMELLEQFKSLISVHVGPHVAEYVLGGLGLLLLTILQAIVRRGWFAVTCFVGSRNRALQAVQRIETSDGPREGKGVWQNRPVSHPLDYERNVAASKIFVLANYKGGVGKTTLAANIGAFLASPPWNKRVLLVDLDYQGSLSSMVLPRADSWQPPLFNYPCRQR